MTELEKEMLHALRMDHGHTTVNEMQKCKTCTRRAREMMAIVAGYLESTAQDLLEDNEEPENNGYESGVRDLYHVVTGDDVS